MTAATAPPPGEQNRSYGRILVDSLPRKQREIVARIEKDAEEWETEAADLSEEGDSDAGLCIARAVVLRDALRLIYSLCAKAEAMNLRRAREIVAENEEAPSP